MYNPVFNIILLLLGLAVSLGLIYFSVLYIIRSFKAFTAVAEINGKLTDAIYVLRDIRDGLKKPE